MSGDKGKKSFVLYTENAKQFNILSDEQAGKLIKAIFAYTDNRTTPEFDDGVIEMAFSFIQNSLDRDYNKWVETCEKRVEAGRSGGKKSQANRANACFASEQLSKTSDAKQSQANQAVNVNDNDNVNVNIPPISPKGDASVKKTSNSEALEKSFDKFWELYPKKKAKTNAIKAWNKLKPDDNLVRIMLSALEKQKKSSQWLKADGDFISYPASWINGRRWEDEFNGGEHYAGQSDSYTEFGGFIPSKGFKK